MHTNNVKTADEVLSHRLMPVSLVKETVAVVILVLIWAFFLRHAFTTGGSFTMYMDNEFFLGPVLSSMSATFAHGQWPLRMDTLLGGIPLYNFAQLSPFYPFYLAIFSIYNHPLEAALSMHWVVIGHLLIFQLNTYIFLRVLSASRLASIAGASLVAFSANSLAYAVWVNITAPYAWLPLFLAGLVGVLQRPNSLKYSSMTLLGIVLLVLASPAQPLIHAIFLSVIFIAFYVVDTLFRHRNFEFFKLLGTLSGIAVVAFLLSSPVIIPVALGLKDTIRWIGAFPPIIGNERIPYAAFQVYQLSVPDLGGAFFQTKAGAVGNQYVGVFPIVLALIAMVSRPRSWVVRSLVVISLYSLISAAGSNLGLLALNYHIPLLNKIREPTRFLVLFQFGIAILAAIGIDELRKRGPDIKRWSRLNIQMLVAAAAGTIALTTAVLLRNRLSSHTSPAVTLLALFALIVITRAVSQKYTGKKPIIATLWAVIAIASLAVEVSWVPPAISTSQYVTSGASALDQALTRITALDPDHEYKVIFDGKIPAQEAGMLASYRGIKVLNFYFNPAPYVQFQEMYYQGQQPGNYFRILGARYLICLQCSAEMTRGFTFRENVAGYAIYEDTSSFPDFFIGTRVNGSYTDWNDFVSKTAGPDLSRGVLYLGTNVSGDTLGITSTSTATKNCSASARTKTPNVLSFWVNCAQPGVLVINQFFDSAWRASIDSTATQVLKVNENQIGVPFSSGAHLVELRYRPRVFVISLILMSIGIFIVFTVLIVAFIRKMRSNIK
ncbi:Bacterial membrane protein YfhO [Caballeronia udeis]|uniref:Bacterial membrane protein YfhO n=1 Tax=Caballeronia udeis TaxID=1232866 RepID=A0A158F2P9_9BURK|nr:hypothetical protein [Caballeronia udeis]SAL13991.1 Bacterial membrane protein YfhO [Caballeronia udeis]